MAKYSKQLVEAICELIADGESTINEICGFMKINRKTFYEWKNEKEDFREAIQLAQSQRNERLVTLARQAARRKMNGYKTVETKYVYVPDKHYPDRLVLKEKIVKEKDHAPDTATINAVLKREDERLRHEEALQREREKEEKRHHITRQPLVIEVINEETKRELEKLDRGERDELTPEAIAKSRKIIEEYNKL
ncbi:hypothetical protein [Dysgonomonas sp. 25]|uniref:terminase small subunit-like protein n=1 Tax=Dysgonomonas sp. 25 TaxID=2302933 RepID=UPI0013D52FC7|nr:hypothetical protein [Dysgonomonas sp. 25]NDV68035.1 hypothetical protein [Dysgonomonas sp. 25]